MHSLISFLPLHRHGGFQFSLIFKISSEQILSTPTKNMYMNTDWKADLLQTRRKPPVAAKHTTAPVPQHEVTPQHQPTTQAHAADQQSCLNNPLHLLLCWAAPMDKLKSTPHWAVSSFLCVTAIYESDTDIRALGASPGPIPAGNTPPEEPTTLRCWSMHAPLHARE